MFGALRSLKLAYPAAGIYTMAIITPAPLGETLKKREKFRRKDGGKGKRRKKGRERKKGRIRREKRIKEGNWRRKEEDNIFILYSLRNIQNSPEKTGKNF